MWSWFFWCPQISGIVVSQMYEKNQEISRKPGAPRRAEMNPKHAPLICCFFRSQIARSLLWKKYAARAISSAWKFFLADEKLSQALKKKNRRVWTGTHSFFGATWRVPSCGKKTPLEHIISSLPKSFLTDGKLGQTLKKKSTGLESGPAFVLFSFVLVASRRSTPIQKRKNAGNPFNPNTKTSFHGGYGGWVSISSHGGGPRRDASLTHLEDGRWRGRFHLRRNMSRQKRTGR